MYCGPHPLRRESRKRISFASVAVNTPLQMRGSTSYSPPSSPALLCAKDVCPSTVIVLSYAPIPPARALVQEERAGASGLVGQLSQRSSLSIIPPKVVSVVSFSKPREKPSSKVQGNHVPRSPTCTCTDTHIQRKQRSPMRCMVLSD